MGLIDDILDEATASHPGWLAKFHPPLLFGVETVSNRFDANDTEKALVQQMGAGFGCHTCNKSIDQTPQNFIVDHIPPRGLFSNPTAWGINYLFFPHCDRCASEQSALVTAVKVHADILSNLRKWSGDRTAKSLAALRQFLKDSGLNPKEIALLTGGAGTGIAGHGGNPTKKDRDDINTPSGLAPISCHSCGSTQAAFIYHADHCPPKEFAMTAWFPDWVGLLESTDEVEELKDLLRRPFFRPQCPSCSHSQGGRCGGLVARAATDLLNMGKKATKRTDGKRPRKVLRYGK